MRKRGFDKFLTRGFHNDESILRLHQYVQNMEDSAGDSTSQKPEVTSKPAGEQIKTSHYQAHKQVFFCYCLLKGLITFANPIPF